MFYVILFFGGKSGDMDDEDADVPEVAEAGGEDVGGDAGAAGAGAARPMLQLDKKSELGFCAFFRGMPKVRRRDAHTHTCAHASPNHFGVVGPR
jgi:hypothetical protein